MGFLDVFNPPEGGPAVQVKEKGDLLARIAELEENERIRSEHKMYLTDDQIKEIKAQRAQEEVRKKAREAGEADRAKREAEREVRIRNLVGEMIADGRLVLHIEGIKTVETDLPVTCPHCRSPLSQITEALIVLAREYDAAPEGEKFGASSSKIVFPNPRDPLGPFIGTAAFRGSEECPKCHRGIRSTAQLVLT